MYYTIPCVPVDFESLNEAITHCNLLDPETLNTSSTTNATTKRDTTVTALDKTITCAVTLMPGVYKERLDFSNLTFKRSNLATFGYNNKFNLCSGDSCENEQKAISIGIEIHIRAAFPEIGAALVHYAVQNDERPNECCIDIMNRPNHLSSYNNSSSLYNLQSHNYSSTAIHISNLQILHCTQGRDIWGGNCAIRCDGARTMLKLDCCTLQSDSGRGVVVTNGAKLFMKRTVIHDCAATGLYIGDILSYGHLIECMIFRNGGGSRSGSSRRKTRRDIDRYIESRKSGGHSSPLSINKLSSQDILSLSSPNNVEDLKMILLNHESSDEDSNISDDIFMEDSDEFSIEDGIHHYHGIDSSDFNHVPPGHSGMYVETGKAVIDDSLIASNSLTGLSVVRGGKAWVSGCDITENGSSATSEEDDHDAMNQHYHQGNPSRIRGGIIFSNSPTNTKSIIASERAANDRNYQRIAMGGFLRFTRFPNTISECLVGKRMIQFHGTNNDIRYSYPS